jgi:hypothetical protein
VLARHFFDWHRVSSFPSYHVGFFSQGDPTIVQLVANPAAVGFSPTSAAGVEQLHPWFFVHDAPSLPLGGIDVLSTINRYTGN